MLLIKYEKRYKYRKYLKDALAERKTRNICHLDFSNAAILGRTHQKINQKNYCT